jgi:hypothetical protein
MALPKQEAEKISAAINKEFGGWGWTAEVFGSENEVIIRSSEKGVGFGFARKLPEFAAIVKGWSFTVRIYEGQIVLVIW